MNNYSTMTEEELNLTEEELNAMQSALTLPSDLAEATDFEASEAVELDMKIKLPDFFSLGEWIYETQNQWSIWSCTAMGTSHSTQILLVKKDWIKPTTNNIYTPDWKDLWRKMWHNPEKYEWGDYVEKAVETALKEWILVKETGKVWKFDAYAVDYRRKWEDDVIDKMKRYLYKWCPIVWCVRWNSTTWNEMKQGEVKTVPTSDTGGHCIALVGWWANWFWFINSWAPNDSDKRKSRFFISFDTMRKMSTRFNWRYWVLYNKEEAKLDPEYLKRKNRAGEVIKELKKIYAEEGSEIKNAIGALSKLLRARFPELNKEVPVNS